MRLGSRFEAWGHLWLRRYCVDRTLTHESEKGYMARRVRPPISAGDRRFEESRGDCPSFEPPLCAFIDGVSEVMENRLQFLGWVPSALR